MKSQTPETECTEGVFLIEPPICTVNFTRLDGTFQSLKPLNYLIKI